MRNEPLTAYVLHARAYQEKRAIYHCFSQEFGIVHGVGKRGAVPFVRLTLLATGKNALKTFSQIEASYHATRASQTLMRGQGQYALLYLNELLYKLLVLENPCPTLFYHYELAVERLLELGDISYHNHDKMTQMKLYLRQFERALFDELGVSVQFACDSLGQPIADGYYEFRATDGFVRIDKKQVGKSVFFGQEIVAMQTSMGDFVNELGVIHRLLLDFLLDYKPLNSRRLWLEQLKYQQ